MQVSEGKVAPEMTVEPLRRFYPLNQPVFIGLSQPSGVIAFVCSLQSQSRRQKAAGRLIEPTRKRCLMSQDY